MWIVSDPTGSSLGLLISCVSGYLLALPTERTCRIRAIVANLIKMSDWPCWLRCGRGQVSGTSALLFLCPGGEAEGMGGPVG